jgi:GntR family transcriptional regulator, transcriptional repressor for pyruvate dehydrogenase complex
MAALEGVEAPVGIGSIDVAVRLPKTSEIIATRLRQQIITGQLAEGAALPAEAALIKMFGVSRPALREALRLLESDGLIVIRRGNQGGARVQAPKSDVAARYVSYYLQYQQVTLADVYSAVTNLEAPSAREVALHRTDADLTMLEQVMNESEQHRHDRPEPALANQRQFHSLIVDLAGNATTKLIWSMLQGIVAASQVANVTNYPHSWSTTAVDAAYRTHRRLVDHIRAQDGDKAESLWRRHLEADREFVLVGMEDASVLDLLKGGW